MTLHLNLHGLNDLIGLHWFATLGETTGNRWWAIVLGVLFAIMTVALLIASWTRWGQTKSLTKCIALAFLAHVWLLMYAYGTRILTPGTGGGIHGGDRTAAVTLSIDAMATFDTPANEAEPQETAKEDEGESTTETDSVKPWEAPIVVEDSSPSESTPMPELTVPTQTPELPVLSESLAPPTPQPEVDESALAEFLANQITPQPLPSSLLQDAPKQESQEISVRTNGAPQYAALPTMPAPSRPASPVDPMQAYQYRFAPNRMEIVRAGGGDESTEASVELALEWLARAQSADGAWYAAEYGAGNVSMVGRPGPDGEYRQNAGVRANTAMTGLALLAFLGAGHHPTEGRYQRNVANGIRFLLSQQLPSGDMSGRDQVGREESVRFARMYSHGMASLALAEAYAMTKDPALLPAIQSACQYSLHAMNPRTGGWRYEFPTDDPGDTSQFGWQAMLLNSAHSAKAISLPSETRARMGRFLDSVATGRDGGLASYRPRAPQYGSPEQPTVSMTAEAMASRMLLQYPVRPSAAIEAQRMILQQLPGRGKDNFYYWYYATLAMYQMRGEGGNSVHPETELNWHQWNQALKQHLCSTQVTVGPSRGSWNPTCVWGAYGGRVYTTTLACLSLEVYYRYLPMYRPTQQVASPWSPSPNPATR